MIMILSRILSSSSSVASLFPARNLESTYLAVWKSKREQTRSNTETTQSSITQIMLAGCKLAIIWFVFKQGLNCNYQSRPIPTNEFSWFVGPFIDERFKGLLHGIDESFVPREAALRHIVHLVLEVQQVLHHVLVFFWGAHYLSSKRLGRESDSLCWGTDKFPLRPNCIWRPTFM